MAARRIFFQVEPKMVEPAAALLYSRAITVILLDTHTWR
jgi:hypothetical protein